jgi:hypothetical protein
MSTLITEMGRVSEHFVYLAAFMAFACAYVVNSLTDSTTRGIHGFFLFILAALAAAAGMKLSGFSITGDRQVDVVFAMAAAMSACVIALTTLSVLANSMTRKI